MRARVIIGVLIGAFGIYWFVVSNFPSRPRHDHVASACINNLRILDSAKQQYAMEKQLSAGTVIEPKQLELFWGRDDQAVLPKCPVGGIYTLNPIGQLPTCSIKDHVLVP